MGTCCRIKTAKQAALVAATPKWAASEASAVSPTPWSAGVPEAAGVTAVPTPTSPRTLPGWTLYLPNSLVVLNLLGPLWGTLVNILWMFYDVVFYCFVLGFKLFIQIAFHLDFINIYFLISSRIIVVASLCFCFQFLSYWSQNYINFVFNACICIFLIFLMHLTFETFSSFESF